MSMYCWPDQSVFIVYCCLSTDLRGRTSSLCVYFTLKLLATSVNCIGHVSCSHNPGTSELCLYPCLFSCFSSHSFASNPDCGSPYMLLLACMYTWPSDVATACRLYSMIILWDVAQFDVNIFWSLQRCHEVEVRYFHCHKFCTLG